MSYSNNSKVNEAVVAKAVRHMDHYGVEHERWFVGIEEAGSDRGDHGIRHPIRYELKSEEAAKRTMSRLLGMGLQADDEYGAEPTILFIYTR
ncbi:hypothetical protein [uncultured Pseudodesulfovibrio sp.]|uniref:hypothetical protein n=1 Tax=uncultured Pseudodesulfovibrio sp. TaxID=2035858 RepID=UPI0029C7BB49|nr:hypothetical protein [uncultured Pseudodesulfovibrio sp.]